MFEYGFAKYLMKVCDDNEVYVNNFFFQNGKRRHYSLHNFVLNDNVRVCSRSKELLYTLYFTIRLFICYPRVVFKWLFSNERPCDEMTFEHSSKKAMYVHFNTFHRFNIIPSKKKIKFIYGNFENYAYIEPILDELRSEFIIKKEPNTENKMMIEELNGCESVCLHIRRGDYLDSRWSMLNVCNFDYYQNAINEIIIRHPNAVFYAFSNTHDDIKWIKENYHFNREIKYVDLGNLDYEELRLMQQCNHFIISNSTFSWWAAVLAGRAGKDVTIPDKWILKQDNEEEYDRFVQDTDGMYLPGWIRVENK